MSVPVASTINNTVCPSGMSNWSAGRLEFVMFGGSSTCTHAKSIGYKLKLFLECALHALTDN